MRSSRAGAGRNGPPGSASVGERRVVPHLSLIVPARSKRCTPSVDPRRPSRRFSRRHAAARSEGANRHRRPRCWGPAVSRLELRSPRALPRPFSTRRRSVCHSAALHGHTTRPRPLSLFTRPLTHALREPFLRRECLRVPETYLRTCAASVRVRGRTRRSASVSAIKRSTFPLALPESKPRKLPRQVCDGAVCSRRRPAP